MQPLNKRLRDGQEETRQPAQLPLLRAAPSAEERTEEQLEQLLAKRRLARETELLQQASTTTSAEVDTVTADSSTGAVGPTLGLQIEGVQVSALVDTGSQATIISHPVLHDIGRRLCEQGRPLPELKKPSVKLP